MSRIIIATFEDGVLKPTQPLELPSPTRVRITIELLIEQSNRQESFAALETLWRQSTNHSYGERLSREQLHERR
jgi:predicted DNA-binding antitoxin AbrB/MazE fold protein